MSDNPEECSRWIKENCEGYNDNFTSSYINDSEIDECAFSVAILKKIAERIKRYIYIKQVLSDFYKSFGKWVYLKKKLKKVSKKRNVKIDFVFFNYFDTMMSTSYECSKLVDYIFPYCYSGIYFGAGDLRKSKNRDELLKNIPELVKYSQKMSSISLLDEGLKEIYESETRKRIVIFPDFADESYSSDFALCKEIKEAAKGRKIVGLHGSISKRKGAVELVKIAKMMVDRELFFIFIGFLDNDFNDEEKKLVDELIALKPENCFFYPNVIEKESQFNSLILICDILYIVYNNFANSSNILTKSALFKKIVFGSKRYLIGERIKKYSLGYVFGEGDIKSQVACLEELLIEDNYFKSKEKAEFDRYLEEHSIMKVYDYFHELKGDI